MLNVTKPGLFAMCSSCQFASDRAEKERQKSLEKHGPLDEHQIIITCEGTFPNFKVMWATHHGMRYPKGDKPGRKVDGVMLMGGQDVDCPGLKSR